VNCGYPDPKLASTQADEDQEADQGPRNAGQGGYEELAVVFWNVKNIRTNCSVNF